MDIQRHSSVLGDTVEKLSDEASYKQLFHAYRDEEALPSGEVLKEIIDLCRAILFPGYYGNARISKQTIRFHTGVNVETLHSLLSKQVYAGLCFADTSCVTCPEEKISAEAEAISEAFISTLPEIRGLLATDVEATFNGDPAAQNLGEVIFCYPGFRAIGNYRIAHQLYKLGVPYIPRMITEMAHSETGIDIHPGAKIGHHFSIDHGTGTVIGETSVIGNYVRIFQGVSLAGEKLPPDENGNAIRGVARHPILEDHVTVYSNSTLIGKIRIGRGATICGNVWIAEDVPAGSKKAKNGVILIDLLSEEEYEDIKKNPQRPYNNAWEMAMNIHDNKVVPTGKVLFFIDGKEASEEELKNMPANEVRGVSRIDNSGEGETTIRVETERNSDKWVLASGIVMDKEGKPMEGVTITMYGTSSSTKTDATGHFELKTPKDASLQISRGEKVLFRTKAAKDIKIVLDK